MFQAQIGKLAVSFTPFFVGMASSVIPQLMGAVEEIQKIDLTAVGQSFGDAIAEAVVMLKDGVATATDIFEKIKAGMAAVDPKKGLFLSAIDAYRKGENATSGVEIDQTKVVADAKAQLEKMGFKLAPKFEAALPKVAASNKPGDEGFIGPMPPTTAERAAEIKAEMLKKYEPKPTDTGIGELEGMGPKSRAEAGAITTSLGKVGGGGNVFGGGGMDIPRQQLDEQKRSNQHLQIIATALTSRNIGLTPTGALA
jgi:hypothetical protein